MVTLLPTRYHPFLLGFFDHVFMFGSTVQFCWAFPEIMGGSLVPSIASLGASLSGAVSSSSNVSPFLFWWCCLFVPSFFFFHCSVFLGLRGEGERGSEAGEQDPWTASLIFWLGSSLCRSVAQGKLTKEQECRPQAGVEMRLVQMHRVRLFNLCAQMPFKDRQLVWLLSTVTQAVCTCVAIQ